jgi:hypothetical protein
MSETLACKRCRLGIHVSRLLSQLTCSQPFDLTDLEWTPELWIAYHDEDEQNARLAQHVWDDNGLDVPEGFLDELLVFLGVFVRSMSHDKG